MALRESHFRIKMTGRDELYIELRDIFNLQDAEELEREISNRFRQFYIGQCTVIFDLRELTECVVFARSVLVRIQRMVASKARRTAYLADRPIHRGLALWVAHLSEDGNAKSVATMDQVRQWCQGTQDRYVAQRQGVV